MTPEAGSPEAMQLPPSLPGASSVEPPAAPSAAQLPWDPHTGHSDGWSQLSPALLKLLEQDVLQSSRVSITSLAKYNAESKPLFENIISGLFVLTELGSDRRKRIKY